MSSILDNLFSILPVVFFIIWILRLARRRSSKEEKKRPTKLIQTASNLEIQGAQTIKSIFNDIKKFAEPIVNSTATQQDHISDKKEHLNEIKVPVLQQNKENTEEETKVVVRAKKEPSLSQANTFDRIRKLSPLAQGLIWKNILDKPPSLQDDY